jgi:hypothetical protein
MVEPSRQSPGGVPDGAPPRRSRAPGAYLNLPLWQRYAVSGVIAVALLAGMVIFVAGHNTDSGPTNINPTATVQANHEAEILVEQDQAPHTVHLPSGRVPVRALESVIHAHVSAQVKEGALSGPLTPARCHPTGAHTATAVGFSCEIDAGSVNYPFLAAVDTAARRVTYCKRDPPPVPSESVPVSSRCRA